MFEIFYPDARAASSYEIDYASWYREGIRGVIFDIDNTLVMHGAPATPEAVALFQKLRNIGLDTCLISNNKAERVAPFAEAVGSRFMSKASKPSRRGYMEAMRLMGTNRNNTLFVGDQLFTDVWGANRCGIRTVLVHPIDPHEEIQIVLKRFLEKPVLWMYERKKAGERKHDSLYNRTR